jgi:hypothetical protein
VWPNKSLHATPVGRCWFVEKILVFGCHKSGVRELFSLGCLAFMAVLFHADFIDASHEDWGWKIVWSVDADLEAERYLTLQRADVPTEQDIQFGMVGVYIECCGQGWSWYGHIVSFELCRDRVRVQLDSEAAQRMHDDGRIEATFMLSDERFAELRSALSQIFQGYGYYKETAA